MNRLEFFDFCQKYKHQWINYCEIIIDKEGKIIIAEPSHIEAMLKLTGENREDIYEKMPITASPIHWFVKYLGYVSVWNNFQLVPETLTLAQYQTLELLNNNNFINYKTITVINP